MGFSWTQDHIAAPTQYEVTDERNPCHQADTCTLKASCAHYSHCFHVESSLYLASLAKVMPIHPLLRALASIPALFWRIVCVIWAFFDLRHKGRHIAQ